MFHRAIRKFGPLIKSIECIGMNFDSDINAIDKCCPSLEELLFIGQIKCDKMHSLLPRLKVLNFVSCTFVGDQTVAFSKCLQLVDLSINNCYVEETDGIIAINFPKLENFTLKGYYINRCRRFSNFLLINPQIQRLNFDVYLNSDMASVIAQVPKHAELLLMLRKYSDITELESEEIFHQLSNHFS